MNVWLRFVRIIMLEDPPQLKQKFQKPILTKFTRTLIPPPQKKRKTSQWLPQPLRASSFWSYYRLINGWWAKLQAWSFIIQNWDLRKTVPQNQRIRPRKGDENFNRKIHLNQPLIFRGQSLVFRGVTWLETKYSSNRAGSMVMNVTVESVKHDLPQIQEKGASVSPFLVILSQRNNVQKKPVVGGFSPTPLNKYLVKMGIPNFRGENKQYLKPALRPNSFD